MSLHEFLAGAGLVSLTLLGSGIISALYYRIKYGSWKNSVSELHLAIHQLQALHQVKEEYLTSLLQEEKKKSENLTKQLEETVERIVNKF